MKILIAEDDLTSRTILVAVVREWGYEPIAVEDGAQALEVLEADNPPQLLLIDWEMPRLNGLALCQHLLEKEKDKPPYIILLTGRSGTDNVVAGLEAGANDYISKPFENAELQARLKVGKRMLELQDELHRAKEAMTIQAKYDVLTGLMNRRAIMEAMEREVDRTKRNLQPLYICMCDIDHFKIVNDTHGHLAGDAILREVAQRISSILRNYDLFGRYGGEEFLIIINSEDIQVQALFDRICRIIADEPFIYGQQVLHITLSCGVTFYSPPMDKRDVTQLLASADEGLYEAKSAGRNRVVFSSASG